MRQLFLAALIVLTFLACGPAYGLVSPEFESISDLPPGEQYRQLSLLLLIAGGTDPELLELLQSLGGGQTTHSGSAAPELTLDDYETPLSRIADQRTMLAGAARMIGYAQQNGPSIQARLKQLAEASPILISMVDVNQIAEDAIIIRNSIADSIEYVADGDDRRAASSLGSYRAETIHLRNMMEYNIFQKELARITDEAIIDLGGRLDAYQRMFDDDIDPDLVKRRVESAEIMNAQTGENFDDQARLRTAELLMMLILMESSVY